MRKDLIYFSVPDEYALGKLKKFFSERFFTSSLKDALNKIQTNVFPCYIKLDGLDLNLVSEAEALSNEPNIIVVRHLQRKVVTDNVSITYKESIDLYPKFRRTAWNSGEVGFRVSTEHDLHDLYIRVAGDKGYELAKSILNTEGSVVILTKEGCPLVCVELETGLTLINVYSWATEDKLKKVKVVDYTKDYKFTSPIELY